MLCTIKQLKGLGIELGFPVIQEVKVQDWTLGLCENCSAICLQMFCSVLLRLPFLPYIESVENKDMTEHTENWPTMEMNSLSTKHLPQFVNIIGSLWLFIDMHASISKQNYLYLCRSTQIVWLHQRWWSVQPVTWPWWRQIQTQTALPMACPLVQVSVFRILVFLLSLIVLVKRHVFVLLLLSVQFD